MKYLIAFVLALSPFVAFAEGNCPPGHYPIGGQGVVGCAPIPGSTQGGGAAKPTGKWETRWGAIAEDFSANERGVPAATGASHSRTSKREANAAAVAECAQLGGQKCKVVLSYNNQCVAIADPKPRSQGGQGGKSTVYRAQTQEMAQMEAMKRCSAGGGAECSVIYSACSVSEFRSF
jgi:hypothetical protein